MKALGWALIAFAVIVFIAMVTLVSIGIWSGDHRFSSLGVLAFCVWVVVGLSGGVTISFAGGDE